MPLASAAWLPPWAGCASNRASVRVCQGNRAYRLSYLQNGRPSCEWPSRLRHQLANFKAVHTLRESAVNLIRTHDGLRPTVPCRQVMLRGVRGSSGAELRPEPSRLSSSSDLLIIQSSLNCTLESAYYTGNAFPRGHCAFPNSVADKNSQLSFSAGPLYMPI